MVRMSRHLTRLGSAPDLVLTPTARRASDTARLAAESGGVGSEHKG